MSKQLRELQTRKSDLVKEARALTDIAAQENRDLTDEDVIKFNGLKSRIEATSAAIDRESALISEEAQMGIHLGAGPTAGPHQHQRDDQQPKSEQGSGAALAARTLRGRCSDW